MTDWLFFIFCSVGLILFFWWRSKRVAPQSKPDITPPASPYHSVTIIPDKNGCASARRQVNQRFLAREAPRLPLPGCDAVACQCRYAHFDDRREDERRNSHALRRGLSSGPGDTDFRSGSDRRREQQASSGQHLNEYFEETIRS